MKLCSVDGCGRKHFANGYCNMHRQRAAKYGDPSVVHRPYDLTETVSPEERQHKNRVTCRAYYRRNAERSKALAAQYREANREKINQWQRDNYRVNSSLYKSHATTRKMRIRDAFVEHVDRDVVCERDDWRCGLCGLSVKPEDVSLDHVVPISRGGKHCYSNVQLAHLTCNMRKGDKVVA